MCDYIKQLEAQNEELKERLAAKELIDCRDNILYKDMVLSYFENMMWRKGILDYLDAGNPLDINKIQELVRKEFATQTPHYIVSTYWGNQPLSVYTFRTAQESNLSYFGESIGDFMKYLVEVIEEYQEKLRKESQ